MSYLGLCQFVSSPHVFKRRKNNDTQVEMPFDVYIAPAPYTDVHNAASLSSLIHMRYSRNSHHPNLVV